MRWVAPLALASVLLGLGCSEPRVVPIIGPDGSHMFHVSCGDQEGECYRLAGEHCPYGYDVGRTIAGAGNMLVRCRAPMAEPVYPAAQYRTPAAQYGTPAPMRANPYAAPSQPASPAPQAPPTPSASAPAPAASSLPRPVNPYGNRDYGF